jgi:hypothetical protein
MNGRTLQSWKEIAQYIGRGVRTVQRWEAMYGLPVHRPSGRSRSAVFALQSEVDIWLMGAGRDVLRAADDGMNLNAEALFDRLQQLEAECEHLRRQLANLGANISAGHSHVGNSTSSVAIHLRRAS